MIVTNYGHGKTPTIEGSTKIPGKAKTETWHQLKHKFSLLTYF